MEQKQMNLAEINRELIILKEQMKQIQTSIKEDLKFALRTELAYRDIEEGKGVKMDFDEFIDEMKK